MLVKHLENDNRAADAIEPTPEMFRLLAKLVVGDFIDILRNRKIP